MAKYSTLSALFTAIANSIRGKTGSTEEIVADDFPAMIDSLSTGGEQTETNLITVPITLTEAVGGDSTQNEVILEGYAFVRQHYADDGFFALWLPLSATTAAESGVAGAIWVGNRPVFTTKSTYYGTAFISTGASDATSYRSVGVKISKNGYNVTLRANSSGNINLYVAAGITMPAGDYLLVLGIAE